MGVNAQPSEPLLGCTCWVPPHGGDQGCEHGKQELYASRDAASEESEEGVKTIILNIAPRLAREEVIENCIKTVYDIVGDGSASIRQNIQNYEVESSVFAMHCHILSALYECPPGTVYICEHDVLYPRDWCDFTPLDGTVSYHGNGYIYQLGDGFMKRKHPPLSTLCADRDLLIEAFTNNLRQFYMEGKIKWCEPRDYPIVMRIGTPYIDIRHGLNATGSRDGVFTPEPPKEWKEYDFSVFDSHTA